MDHEAIFRFRSANAAVIYRSLFPEMAAEGSSRSRAECSLESPDLLVLKVRARDTAALRASLNMWLRLVNVAEEMHALAGE